MSEPIRLQMHVEHPYGTGGIRQGWRASLDNGWTRCRHFHRDPEAAIDCLHQTIAQVFALGEKLE